MKTGTMTVEVDYDDEGNPLDVRVSGEASGNGQLATAAAMIRAASESAGVTTRSGVFLMARMAGWDWLHGAILDAAMEDE